MYESILISFSFSELKMENKNTEPTPPTDPNKVTPVKGSPTKESVDHIQRLSIEVVNLEQMLADLSNGLYWHNQGKFKENIARARMAYQNALRNDDPLALDDGKYDFINPYAGNANIERKDASRTLYMRLEKELSDYIWWLHSALDVYE